MYEEKTSFVSVMGQICRNKKWPCSTIILAYISNIILVYVNWIYVTLFTITSSFLSILLITALWILLYGCVCVIDIITLSSVWNVYLFVWTMDHVLFGVYLKFTRGVSHGHLTSKIKLLHFNKYDGVFSWWKSLGLGTITRFVVTWQSLSNHGLINVIRFISW